MSETAKKTKRAGARQAEKSTAGAAPKRKRKAERAFPYVRILIGEMVLGPGKVDLLEAIGRTGSISAAGRELGMSYRRAWLLVDALNHMFPSVLVAASPGGVARGRRQAHRLRTRRRGRLSARRDAGARRHARGNGRLQCAHG